MSHYKKSVPVHFKSLPPLSNVLSEILILNNAPSDKSVKTGQYYSQPRSLFWELMFVILNEKAENYSEKTELLLKNKIALWSVLSEGDKVGKNNFAFESEKANDIEKFLSEHPAIRRIIFNGESALFYFKKHVRLQRQIEMFVAKSTNPIKNRRRPFEVLLSSWQPLF